MRRCGCEEGGDCTKTTVCEVDAALEDQAEYIRSLEEQLGIDNKPDSGILEPTE